MTLKIVITLDFRRYRRIIWPLFWIIIIGSLLNLVLSIAGLQDLKQSGTVYYWPALFYGYTIKPITWLALPILALAALLAFQKTEEAAEQVAASCGKRLSWSLFAFCMVHVTILNLVMFTIVGRVVEHEDSLSFEGKRYHLVRVREDADLDCGSGEAGRDMCEPTTSYYFCSCDSLGFSCTCRYVEGAFGVYSAELDFWAGGTIWITLNEHKYAVRECEKMPTSDCGYCRDFEIRLEGQIENNCS